MVLTMKCIVGIYTKGLSEEKRNTMGPDNLLSDSTSDGF